MGPGAEGSRLGGGDVVHLVPQKPAPGRVTCGSRAERRLRGWLRRGRRRGRQDSCPGPGTDTWRRRDRRRAGRGCGPRQVSGELEERMRHCRHGDGGCASAVTVTAASRGRGTPRAEQAGGGHGHDTDYASLGALKIPLLERTQDSSLRAHSRHARPLARMMRGRQQGLASCVRTQHKRHAENKDGPRAGL